MKKPGKIKAALLDWLGIPVGLTDTAFWSQIGTTAAGQQVNNETILKLTAVWACSKLISGTISTLPIGIYERTSSGRQAAKDLPLYTIIHDMPNSDSVASVFWEAMISAMLLRGNAFAEKLTVGGRLVGLVFLSNDRLSIQKKQGGGYKYTYYPDGQGSREILESDIFHIPGYSTGGKWGLSVIQYGAGVFGSALAADTAANSTFEKGLSPTVAFSIDRVLTPDQRNEFRTNTSATLKGSINAGESPLLEAGMTAQILSINPKDAQLLESRQFSGEEICRWFLLDPSMVGYGNKVSNWGTGLEQKNISLLTYCLRPILIKVEQHVKKDLMTPAQRVRFYAEYNIEGLLRGDSAARKEFYSSALQNGWMNRNAVAALENQPSIPGGDVYTVQSNLIPIDQLGAANTDSQQLRASLMNFMGIKEVTNETKTSDTI